MFDELTEDEAHSRSYFRNADRLERAGVMLATCRDKSLPTPEETQRLEFVAASMDCSDYGRARCVETAEVFAEAATIEVACARLAEVDDAWTRCKIIDIADFRAG